MLTGYRKFFFALLQAGLWEQGVRLSPYGKIDYSLLYDIADGQSVVGLIAAGLEHVEDTKIVKHDVRPFLIKVFSLEGRNNAMNIFINNLIGRMRSVGINPLLVKGQGVAQCYSRPLWRSSGDIDLLLDPTYYKKAKKMLTSLASSVKTEEITYKHFGATVDSWCVELHGTLYSGLSGRINRMLDLLQKESCSRGAVRVWRNGEVDIQLPNVNNDVIFIFSHILQHFFHGGIGLRQVCDWCRLLWTFRSEIDIHLLKQRLMKMKLMTEWKAFGSLAVKYLGHPTEHMPFYDSSFEKKGDLVMSLILEKRNSGHKDNQRSVREEPSTIKRKFITIRRQLKENAKIFRVFPLDSFCFLWQFFYDGFRRTKTVTKLEY